MLRNLLIPVCCGLLFGAGLAISGMSDTRVVLDFLDVTGAWNPALLFVMGGALAVTIPGFWLTKKRGRPFLTKEFHIPVNCSIEAKPIIGSAIFGVGWGLYGYCPGPALASLGTLDWQPALFVVALAAGVYAEKMLSRMRLGAG
jgi:uncharacterized membrane protein YedE/YeeE